jgi:hypothetical protein
MEKRYALSRPAGNHRNRCAPPFEATPENIETTMTEVRHRFIETNGTRIHIAEQGAVAIAVSRQSSLDRDCRLCLRADDIDCGNGCAGGSKVVKYTGIYRDVTVPELTDVLWRLRGVAAAPSRHFQRRPKVNRRRILKRSRLRGLYAENQVDQSSAEGAGAASEAARVAVAAVLVPVLRREVRRQKRATGSP